jgi:hypothetical protein
MLLEFVFPLENLEKYRMLLWIVKRRGQRDRLQSVSIITPRMGMTGESLFRGRRQAVV